MRAFYYIWEKNNWYDIAAEQLSCLGRAGFPGHVRIFLGGSSDWAAQEVLSVAGACGLKASVEWCAHNPNESLGIVALKSQCDGTSPTLYFHAKNVTLKGVYGSKWRWMMNYHVLAKWRERLREMEQYDVTGVCYKNDPVHGPIMAGNFWWARGEWIRSLPGIGHGLDRFAYEKWLLSRPGPRICSLVSDGGTPHIDSYYARNGNPQDAYLKFASKGD